MIRCVHQKTLTRGRKKKTPIVRLRVQRQAGLIDKLKATKEADGSSLFDHVALAYGSNIRSIHYLDNCPTVLTGGGANLKLGLDVERHGGSTGVVKELQGS